MPATLKITDRLTALFLRRPEYFRMMVSSTYPLSEEQIEKYKDDTVRNIEIIPVGNIYVPNAFTPNNDGVNHVFKPSIINIEEDSYQFSVFNRWGNLIFETTDTNQGWSGNFKGTASQEGIYVYVIRAKTKDGRLLDLTGEITLTRY